MTIEKQAKQYETAIEIIVESLTCLSVGLPEIVADPVARSILAKLARNEPPILLAYASEIKE